MYSVVGNNSYHGFFFCFSVLAEKNHLAFVALNTGSTTFILISNNFMTAVRAVHSYRSQIRKSHFHNLLLPNREYVRSVFSKLPKRVGDSYIGASYPSYSKDHSILKVFDDLNGNSLNGNSIKINILHLIIFRMKSYFFEFLVLVVSF